MSVPHLLLRTGAVSLIIHAIRNVIELWRSPGGGQPAGPLAAVFMVALWLFLLSRVLKKPRTWGFGVGIFLVFIIVTQTTFWRLALSSSRAREVAIGDSVPQFLLSITPLIVGAFCFVPLRWLIAKETNQPPKPPR